MKIYTKTGDDGLTGLLGPGRVYKDAPRIEAYGTVDELNASLGLARALAVDPETDALLALLQSELFSVGAALADPSPDGPFHNSVTEASILRLEQTIDVLEAELPPLTQFILPGGAPSASQLHLSRTICRRAERAIVGLTRSPGESVPVAILVYLNRLSDLLFVLARVVNQRAGIADVVWKAP